jgi:hypothetical protein
MSSRLPAVGFFLKFIVSSVLIHPVLDVHHIRLLIECLKPARILITPKVSHMILVFTNSMPGLNSEYRSRLQRQQPTTSTVLKANVLDRSVQIPIHPFQQ